MKEDYGFNKVVIWGLRRSTHTHRHIHHHFFHALRRMGIPCVWCDDSLRNAGAVSRNDLVISANVGGKNLPVVAGAHYVLHNFDHSFVDTIPFAHRIMLQVFTRNIKEGANAEKWEGATYFDSATRTLYQPWGTNLPATGFYRPLPAEIRKRCFSFWVGSVWQNSFGQGNTEQIAQFKSSLKEFGKRFVHLRFIPDRLNAMTVRQSFLAPAIGGGWQAENGYLPCRMFKNISYGHLGLSNIAAFGEVFGNELFTPMANARDLIAYGLSLRDSEFAELIREQQEIVRRHTYETKLTFIMRAMRYSA
jgi:hypothetical protein